MVHHGRTPASVLDAPGRATAFVVYPKVGLMPSGKVDQHGDQVMIPATRAERRKRGIWSSRAQNARRTASERRHELREATLATTCRVHGRVPIWHTCPDCGPF